MSSSPSRPDLAWVEPHFAVGSKPYEGQQLLVRAQGVRTVVSVVELAERECDIWRRLDVSVHAFPTPDNAWIPPGRFDQVVGAILASLDAGQPVLLHCLAGINRAPTFATATLCYRYGWSVEEALHRVCRARPVAAPTPEQLDAVRDWLTWTGAHGRPPRSAPGG